MSLKGFFGLICSLGAPVTIQTLVALGRFEKSAKYFISPAVKKMSTYFLCNVLIHWDKSVAMG